MGMWQTMSNAYLRYSSSIVRVWDALEELCAVLCIHSMLSSVETGFHNPVMLSRSVLVLSRCHSRPVKIILSANFSKHHVREICLRFCMLVGSLHSSAVKIILAHFQCCGSSPSFQASFIMPSIVS